MQAPEFTALQVTVLVRTQPGAGQPVKDVLNGVDFHAQLQELLATQVKSRLTSEAVAFEEVIISLDVPASKAKKSRSKSSLIGRFFGDS
jgi:hypothetical protein